MRLLVAGATGVVGRSVLPLLDAAGHEVVGTTPRRAGAIAQLGARPLVLDVLDREAVLAALSDERPDVIIHRLTDLSGAGRVANGRLRAEGTRNLVDAALEAGAGTMVAQSIAWLYAADPLPAVESDPLDPGRPAYPGVHALESAVAEMPRGVVLRYGALYGPGTWHDPDGAVAEVHRRGEHVATPAWASFLHVDDAASAAVAALDWPAGPVNVVDDEPARGLDWMPVLAEAVGAPPPRADPAAEATGRPISNAAARALGRAPAFPTWRSGFARQAA